MVVQEYERLFRIDAPEELGEGFAVMAKTCGRHIVTAGEGDACHFYDLVLEQRDIVCSQVFAGSLHAAYILVVAGDAVDAVG